MALPPSRRRPDKASDFSQLEPRSMCACMLNVRLWAALKFYVWSFHTVTEMDLDFSIVLFLSTWLSWIFAHTSKRFLHGFTLHHTLISSYEPTFIILWSWIPWVVHSNKDQVWDRKLTQIITPLPQKMSQYHPSVKWSAGLWPLHMLRSVFSKALMIFMTLVPKLLALGASLNRNQAEPHTWPRPGHIHASHVHIKTQRQTNSVKTCSTKPTLTLRFAVPYPVFCQHGTSLDLLQQTPVTSSIFLSPATLWSNTRVLEAFVYGIYGRKQRTAFRHRSRRWHA